MFSRIKDEGKRTREIFDYTDFLSSDLNFWIQNYALTIGGEIDVNSD
jgi:hypothetical protein